MRGKERKWGGEEQQLTLGRGSKSLVKGREKVGPKGPKHIRQVNQLVVRNRVKKWQNKNPVLREGGPCKGQSGGGTRLALQYSKRITEPRVTGKKPNT